MKFMICTYNKHKSLSSGNITNSHVAMLNRAISFSRSSKSNTYYYILA